MSSLELRGIRKAFGAIEILKGIDLDINLGEFVVFVGPSGCGKSTLLRMIAGLEEISSGSMKLDGQVMNRVPAAKRGIAMVFQSYALYPHMTVRDNMSFGMKIAGLPKTEIERRVGHAGNILQLTHLLDRLPRALSGGQRQRVAIGRAICRDPKVFLFDEPLSNLDASLRVATRLEIAKLKQSMPETTMIYVTHDQVEAMTLADRIVVLSAGQIEQVGTPMQLYLKPANRFVAQFIGSPAMNMLPCRIESDAGRKVFRLPNGRAVPSDLPAQAAVGSEATLGIRPEALFVSEGDDFLFDGHVAVEEALGEVTQLYVETDLTDQPVIVKAPGTTMGMQGRRLRFGTDPSKLHAFDQAGRSLAA